MKGVAMGFLDSGGNALLLRLHNGDCNGWMQVREREREGRKRGSEREREEGDRGNPLSLPLSGGVEWWGGGSMK